MRIAVTLMLIALIITGLSGTVRCDEETAQRLLREGLLGAATGAVASEASGGKAGKGALVGAGVNIVGGMLFDAISGQKVEKVETVEGMGSTEAFQRGYQAGYQQGFEKGYSEGHQTGLQNK